MLLRRRMIRVHVVAVASLVLTPVTVLAQDKFFESNGVSIRYIEQGAGEPVVLLHGNGGSVATWLDSGRFRDFAANYRTIAFDMRGHGKSGKPRDAKQYGREMALDVVRLLDHLEIPRAHIVGFSLGGIITSQLLTLHPERVLTATLVAGTARLEWNDEMARGTEQEAVERERECISRTLILRNAPPGESPAEEEPAEEDLKARSTTCFADPNQDRFAMAALTRSRPAQVLTPIQVAAVRVPTLGIVGSLDPNRVGLETLKTLRGDLRLVVVEGATHTGNRGILTRPELMIAIREFVAAHRQTSSQPFGPPVPESVIVPSGPLRLAGLLWKPLGSGRFPASLFSHGNGRNPTNALVLGPVFARHGYLFLYLFRRGNGPSGDQAPFYGDLVNQERRANGAEAAERLGTRLLVNDYLDDTSAGLSFLRSRSDVNASRMSIVGHSQGGQLALLAAERDSALRAVLSFAPAALAWDNASHERRQALISAAGRSKVPAFVIFAANDYSLAPGKALDAEMTRVGRPHRFVIFPSFGQTAAEGHGFAHLAVPIWERDVFEWLDEKIKSAR